eukprot:1729525-Amphidinium_carterae.1
MQRPFIGIQHGNKFTNQMYIFSLSVKRNNKLEFVCRKTFDRSSANVFKRGSKNTYPCLPFFNYWH